MSPISLDRSTSDVSLTALTGAVQMQQLDLLGADVSPPAVERLLLVRHVSS